ncbi:hypothetical protein [Gallaecimonas pentaromativorans]|uniref:Uncharacterized protein n=1 Tax=Gallaecimonas pentaromativorans TaxID=584787 RepID=A0A3N1P1X1_9GAMM|nr:hypothetical protein [Gallaecimonas pentaromativorans]MED5526072.1 hypothetical protein [Pseudomonadota bacterium]ROQ22049.1 hypothetical protein EDC28_111151 [Gallaecimonas pentaromativorans]
MNLDLFTIILTALFALCGLVSLHLLSQLLGLVLFRNDGKAGRRIDRLLVSLCISLTSLLLLMTMPQAMGIRPLWFMG